MPRVPATCRTLLAPLTPHRLRPADSPPQLLEECGQVNRNTACAQLSRSGRLLRTQRGGGRRRAPRRHYRRAGVAPCVTRTGGNAAGGAVGGSSMRTMCAIFANWPSMAGSACTSLVSALAHAQVSAVRRRRAACKHAHARAPNISCERSARDAPPVHLSPMERTMRRWLSRVPMTDLRNCTSSVCAPPPIAPRPGGRARALAARAGLGRLELRSEAPGNDTRGAQGTAARRAGCLHRRAPGARCGAPARPNFFFLRALHESVRVVARAIAGASLKTCLVGRDLRAPAHHTLADNAEGVFNGCSCGRGAS